MLVVVAIAATQLIRSPRVAAGSPPPSPPLGSLDHFLCYQISRGITGRTVNLTSQFGATAATVRRAQRLCAPADKEGEDPTAPSDVDHLTGYSVRTRVPVGERRDQIVVNQFGTLTVDLVRPAFLLVPTGKSTIAPPASYTPAIDHFECFRTVHARFRKSGIHVTDQFDARTVNVRRPSRLCIPVDKDGGGITDPGANLMCYRVSGKPRLNDTHVFTTNQFGADEYTVGVVRELCVPSQLNPGAPTVTPTATPTATATDTPAGTPEPGSTATLTPEPSPTATDEPTLTATSTPGPGSTATSEPDATPTATSTTGPSPSPTPGCGDGTCGADESANDCPADCGCAAVSDACTAEYVAAPGDCSCGPSCFDNGDCCADVCTACPDTVGCNCGDGTCDAGETYNNCAADCTCGDGVCDLGAGEDSNNCSDDCYCGDGVCEPAFEDAIGCENDCYCGDGICDNSETDASCGSDCGCGATGTQCTLDGREQAPYGCYCDEICSTDPFDCCADVCDVCSASFIFCQQ